MCSSSASPTARLPRSAPIASKLTFQARRCRRARCTSRPRALTHGDLHLDNLLFDARARDSVVVLDWQGASLGAPAWDVAYFLCDSLSVEDRRAAEAGLLERYVELLAEHGVTDYSLEVLRREIPLALLAQLAGTVGWLTTIDETELTDRERALQQAVLGDGSPRGRPGRSRRRSTAGRRGFEKDLR